jgi:hypothetical protein
MNLLSKPPQGAGNRFERGQATQASDVWNRRKDSEKKHFENPLRNPVRLSISAGALPLASNGLNAGLADDTTINSPFRERGRGARPDR